MSDRFPQALALACVAVLGIAAHPALAQWYISAENDLRIEDGRFVEAGPDGSVIALWTWESRNSQGSSISAIDSTEHFLIGSSSPSSGKIHDLAVTRDGDPVIALGSIENSALEGFSLRSRIFSGESPGGIGTVDRIRIETGGQGSIFVLGAVRGELELGNITLSASGDDQAWFLARLDTDNEWEWAQILEYAATDFAVDGGGAITVASSDSVYRYSATGELRWEEASPVDPVYVGESPGGGAVIAGHGLKVAKLNADGQPVWTREGMVSGEASLSAADVDQIGRIYLMGYFTGSIRLGNIALGAEFTFIGSDEVRFFETLYTAIMSKEGRWLWAFKELLPLGLKAYEHLNVARDIAGFPSAVYLTGSNTSSPNAFDRDAYVARVSTADDINPPNGSGAGAQPNRHALDANYPNPFKTSTTVAYYVARGSRVRITLLDVLGRELRTVVDGWKERGSYSLRVNLASLPSGTYFYRMEAQDFSDVRAMTLSR